MENLLLPLFPLEVVLFPGQPLPLHVFEDRYKEMIGLCLENRAEFGVVLVKENAVLNVGCTAEITNVKRRYKDGRLDIEAVGRRRFEVLFLDQEKAFLRAGAQFFDDEDPAPQPELARRALVLHNGILEMLFADQEERRRQTVEGEAPLLSFRLAGPLPMDLDFKQVLLSMRSESERLEKVVEYLEKLTVRMRLVSRVRARAGGNGEGR